MQCDGDMARCGCAAAEGGHLEVLQWARANGCPWDEWTTCAYAADDDLGAGVPASLRLPAKPLGELNDLVEVPRHSIIGLANRRDGGISSKPKAGGNGTDVYFVGIIDILQQYNTSKYAETMIKSVSSDRATISCVPPGEYADRFVNFLSQFIE